MKLAYTIRKPGARRALKAALALSIILVTALGAFAAKLLFEDHQVNAELTLKLFKKNANGSMTIDQTRGTVNLTIATKGVGSGAVSTSHVWRFRSEKGRQVTVSLPSPGRFRLDAPNGWLNLDLPFVVEADGKRYNQSIRLTNESLSTPSAKKAARKPSLRAAASAPCCSASLPSKSAT